MLQSSVRSSSSASKGESSEGNFTRQGSLRKVIPADSNKSLKLSRSDHDEIQKEFKKYQQEYSILGEYNRVATETIKGVYTIPSRKDPLLWFGVIFVRSGLYEEGIFRFNIQIPESFPICSHPKVIFTSKVFHPVIDDLTGELNLKGGFPEWRLGEEHIWQILKYISWIFSNFSDCLNHAVNEFATEMYKNEREMFLLRVKECVKLSLDHLYDPPPTDDRHYLTFEEYKPDVHDVLRQKISETEPNQNHSAKGHSWVASGRFKAISVPTSGGPSLQSWQDA